MPTETTMRSVDPLEHSKRFLSPSVSQRLLSWMPYVSIYHKEIDHINTQLSNRDSAGIINLWDSKFLWENAQKIGSIFCERLFWKFNRFIPNDRLNIIFRDYSASLVDDLKIVDCLMAIQKEYSIEIVIDIQNGHYSDLVSECIQAVNRKNSESNGQ